MLKEGYVMPVRSSETVSIAWFKLAECVRRGEKERALSVYRLLVHSLNDDAVAYQLKGDIVSIFGLSDDAVAAYHKAATQFEKEHRLSQAAYARECIVFHDQRCYHSYHILVDWYTKIGVLQRAKTIFRYLLYSLIHEGYISRAYEALQSFAPYFSPEENAYAYELFVYQSLQKSVGSADKTMVHTGIANMIDMYRDMHNEDAIHTLCDSLSRIDEQASRYAQQYYENG